MDFGSKFVYLGNEDDEVDYEEVKISEVDNCALSDSDCSDDDGETCMLDILDTAGQEEFSSMRDLYAREGDGFLIVYSITDRKSLEEAEAIYGWLNRLRGESSSPAILVANKQDVLGSPEVQVAPEEGRDLANKLGISFYETSAKMGDGVEAAFHGLVRAVPRTGGDYKIVMLGAGAVGKSSLTVRFVSNTFVSDYDPTIEDSFRKMVTVSGLSAMTKEQKKAQKKAEKAKRKRNIFKPSSGRSQSRRMVSGGQLGSTQNAAGPSPAIPPRPKSGLASLLRGLTRNLGSSPAHQPPMAPQVNYDEYCGQDIDEYIDEDWRSQAVKKVRQRKADGNMVHIPLRNLADDPNLVTGDPIKCKNCSAVLTSTAVLQSDPDGGLLWKCEFCGEANKGLDITEDEIPKGESFDYMLSPPTKPKEEAKEGEAAAGVETKVTPGVLVYCMDISSSMSSLCRVPESHAMWREERTHGEESISAVTRLRCIQKAIERLAEQLKLEQPQKQVLLTVFSSSVHVKGGGRTDGRLPEFTRLENVSFENLLEKGLQLANEYPLKEIEESHEAIDAAVKALHVSGCTALGPALSICTGYVSKIPSSEIILCTDGEPNTGVGNLNVSAGQEFYSMIGNYARSKNITINILSMEGAPTGLQHVSKAAENSGGTTTKLNPVEIVRQLRLIAQNEVVATQVTVTFFLHPGFVFDEPDFPENLSKLEKEVGSVKKETDLTFRFRLREGASRESINSVPFQVQIHFTRPDGMECLRVLSRRTEATTDRRAMEEGINVAVVGVSAMKTTAKMARLGQAPQAQQMVKNFKRLVDRGAKGSKQREERLAFKSEVAKLDNHLTDNQLRLASGSLGDEDLDVYEGASHSNVVQQCSSTSHTKMAALSKRKMNEKSKTSYYNYRDDI